MRAQPAGWQLSVFIHHPATFHYRRRCSSRKRYRLSESEAWREEAGRKHELMAVLFCVCVVVVLYFFFFFYENESVWRLPHACTSLWFYVLYIYFFLNCLYSPATRFCSLKKKKRKKTGLCWTLVGTKTKYRRHLWHHIGRRVPQLCVRHSFGSTFVYFLLDFLELISDKVNFPSFWRVEKTWPVFPASFFTVANDKRWQNRSLHPPSHFTLAAH